MPSQTLTITNNVAEPITNQRSFSAHKRTGRYTNFAPTMIGLSFSLTLPDINIATAAGTIVIENTIAASNAKMTVAAIG